MEAMLSTSTPRFLHYLIKRIRSRPDTECQQALIRVVIGFIFLAYFSSDYAVLDDAIRGPAQFISILFTGIAILIVALSLIRLNISPAHHHNTKTQKKTTKSFLLTYTGEAGSPLLV